MKENKKAEEEQKDDKKKEEKKKAERKKKGCDEVTAEEEETLGIREGQTFGDWRITKKLGEGGFGKVFKVEHTEMKGYFAALKAERVDGSGDTAIKMEAEILRLLQKGRRDGPNFHVLQLFHCRRRKKFHYMVVTLLGTNLRSVRTDRENQRVSTRSWSRLAIQCLYGLKLLHDIGYIHRDIKPANFALGNRIDSERVRIVHILDFGLARQFACKKRGKWIVRKARPTCDFRGTYRYSSPNMHAGREQGRVDDVWSLMYVLIEMHCGLPWQREGNKKRIYFAKLNIPDGEVMARFPVEMHEIIPALRKLNYYNRPDYSMIHDACLQLMKKLNVHFNDPYDWEREKDVVRALRNRTKKPGYEDAKSFFEMDPLNIDESPTFERTEDTVDPVTTRANSPTSQN